MDPAIALLILKVVDLIAAGLELAPELLARKEEYVRKIEAMIAEGRGPSVEEMDELMSEGDDITSRIRAALAAKRHRFTGEGAED